MPACPSARLSAGPPVFVGVCWPAFQFSVRVCPNDPLAHPPVRPPARLPPLVRPELLGVCACVCVCSHGCLSVHPPACLPADSPVSVYSCLLASLKARVCHAGGSVTVNSPVGSRTAQNLQTEHAQQNKKKNARRRRPRASPPFKV